MAHAWNVCCAVRVGIGGVGWGNNVHVNLNTHGLGSSLALSHARHATLWDLLLHLHRHVMLRSGIFSCTCTHTSCYALGSSLALSHARHATLWDLLLHLHTHTKAVPILLESTCLFCSYVLRTFFLAYAFRAASFLFPVFLVFLPGFARALSL